MIRFTGLFAATLTSALVLVAARSTSRSDLGVLIEGGKYGDEIIQSFVMDKHLVSVAAFDEFVNATKYITDAEKYGSAGVFDEVSGSYIAVAGANYQFPFGKDMPAASSDHPVTQVSYNDAMAYAKWRGKRLPTKTEWEFAATNRNATMTQYAWGETLVKEGKFLANTWQGSFPFTNTVEDGYKYTSPVGAFGENEIGLTDMGGNVWQWCSDTVHPQGYDRIIDPSPRKMLKGGSYLCDPMVCHGFRVAGESSSSPESSMANIGFRCVKDL